LAVAAASSRHASDVGRTRLLLLKRFDVIDQRLDFRADGSVLLRTLLLDAELETPSRHIAHQMRRKALSSVDSVVNFLARKAPVVSTAQLRQVDGGIATRRAHRRNGAFPVVAMTPRAVGEVVRLGRRLRGARMRTAQAEHQGAHDDYPYPASQKS